MRNEARFFDRKTFAILVTGLVLGVPLGALGQALPDCDSDAGDPPAGSQAWQDRDTANQVCAVQRMVDEYSNPAMTRKFWIETSRTYTDDVVGQALDPTRPRATLAQWIPGGETADPYRVSFYYGSRYSLDGGATSCADMRAGCP